MTPCAFKCRLSSVTSRPTWAILRTVYVETPLARVIGPGMLLVFIVGDVLGAGIYALVGVVAGETGGRDRPSDIRDACTGALLRGA
mgnify:CR=1 FL=1